MTKRRIRIAEVGPQPAGPGVLSAVGAPVITGPSVQNVRTQQVLLCHAGVIEVIVRSV
jgi:hypothetical protein